MMVLCCSAYDVLLVCRMNANDLLALLGPKTPAKGAKDKTARPAWLAAFVKRQVCC